MDILFSNITVVTMNEGYDVLFNAFVGVQDGKISYVSRTAPEAQPQSIVDGTGMVLMPGLINSHVHLPMTLLRGYADDYDLHTWLNEHIFPREARLDDRAVKAATLLGIAECLRFGVTSVSEMYDHVDAIAEAVAETGIKANIARGTTMFIGDDFDFETFPACKELVAAKEKWHNFDNGRIRIEACIHGEYTSTYQLWDAVSEYAINEGIGMHVHLSETKSEHDGSLDRNGLTPAQVLDCHNIWHTRAIAAHCVWLEPEDRKLLAKRGVSAVHCPVSNAKLGGGTADVVAMVKDGMNVCLGTDGTASNNNLDMFEEIKAAALTAKARACDPTALNARAALLMATVCGAKAQGREAECGQIKVGMDADLIMLDFTQPHLIPTHDVISSLVYAASGHDVVMTMVRGKILYAAGKYATIDLNAVVKELAEYAMPKVFDDSQKEG